MPEHLKFVNSQFQGSSACASVAGSSEMLPMPGRRGTNFVATCAYQASRICSSAMFAPPAFSRRSATTFSMVRP